MNDWVHPAEEEMGELGQVQARGQAASITLEPQ